MSRSVLKGYEAASETLIEKFEAISSADLFSPVLQYLPKKPSKILDVGAGTGRNASWFAGSGHSVVAVEPVESFRKAGKQLHPSPNIEWVNDMLPGLQDILARDEVFDLILLCAVWQHLEDTERKQTLTNLRAVTCLHGRIVMSIRHGAGATSRPVYPAKTADAQTWAKASGFRTIFEASTESVQLDNRDAGVTWTWVVLEAC